MQSSQDPNKVDLSQRVILPILSSFLAQLGREDPAWDKMATDGHCEGFTTIGLVAKWLSTQPLQFDKDGKERPRDDWNWFKNILLKLINWDRNIKSNGLTATDIHEIERFISILKFYQETFNYLPLKQGFLEHNYQDTTITRKARCDFAIGGLFTLDDFDKTIEIDKKKTTLFDELVKNNDLVFVQSYNHATGMMKSDGEYIYFDSNNLYYDKDKDELVVETDRNTAIESIFKYNIYDPKKPSPLGFRVISFSNTAAAYPSPQVILKQLETPIKSIALEVAIDIGSNESVIYYLENGAVITDKALREAIETDRVDVLGNLIRYYPEKNINKIRLEANKKSLIFYAAEEGRPNAVKMLLDRKADIKTVGTSGESILHAAAKSNDLETLQLLIAAGADIHAVDKSGRTPLHIAVESNNRNIAFELLRLGAKIEAKTNEGETPLYIAAHNNNIELVRSLIKHDADIKVKNKSGKTLLHLFSIYDHPDLAKLVISSGIDVDSKCDGIFEKQVNTPLYLAAEHDRYRVIIELLSYGADHKMKCESGVTPLICAARGDHVRSVSAILENAKNITMYDFIDALHNFYSLESYKMLIDNLKYDFLQKLFHDEKGDIQIKIIDEYYGNKYRKDPVYTMLLLLALEALRYKLFASQMKSTKLFETPKSKTILAAEVLREVIASDLPKENLNSFNIELTQGDLGLIYSRWKDAGALPTNRFTK